jgi:hypothetical protein
VHARDLSGIPDRESFCTKRDTSGWRDATGLAGIWELSRFVSARREDSFRVREGRRDMGWARAMWTLALVLWSVGLCESAGIDQTGERLYKTDWRHGFRHGREPLASPALA